MPSAQKLFNIERLGAIQQDTMQYIAYLQIEFQVLFYFMTQEIKNQHVMSLSLLFLHVPIEKKIWTNIFEITSTRWSLCGRHMPRFLTLVF